MDLFPKPIEDSNKLSPDQMEEEKAAIIEQILILEDKRFVLCPVLGFAQSKKTTKNY
jgi:hypothetical protein